MAHTIQYQYNVFGAGNPQIVEALEGTSETFKKGALVLYDDSEDGWVIVPSTNGVPDAQAMFGIALKDATNVTSSFATIPVLVPRPGDVFSAAVASDLDTLAAPGIDKRGDLAGLIFLSSTAGAGTEVAVDSGNTNWVRIQDLHPQDVARRGGISSLAAGDRVLFTFLGAVIDSNGTQA
jgi:hypothetical protein